MAVQAVCAYARHELKTSMRITYLTTGLQCMANAS